jgi:hypothetical protein
MPMKLVTPSGLVNCSALLGCSDTRWLPKGDGTGAFRAEAPQPVEVRRLKGHNRGMMTFSLHKRLLRFAGSLLNRR